MRTISWFSCGAASAVATKLAISTGESVTVAYCEVAEEHPDNKRFLKDCEKWFGQEIIVLGNDKYNRSIYEVFEATRYLKGPSGARCTGELKKAVRKEFELANDRQVFGYTVDEKHRVGRFVDANNDVDIWPILIEKGLTKEDCLAMVKRAGIKLPTMYKLGYRNNNCIGCVKGEAGYWNKVRVDFPAVFERMAKMEELLGRTVCKIEKTVDGKRTLERISLRELPPDQGSYPTETEIQCGIFCELAERDYAH
jgi:hypothetical protein